MDEHGYKGQPARWGYIFLWLMTIVLLILALGVVAGAQVQAYSYKDNSFPQQVNIGKGSVSATHPSAYLEIGPRSGAVKAVAIPSGNRASVPSPVVGSVIYELTEGAIYYYNGSWNKLSSGISPPFTTEDAQDAAAGMMTAGSLSVNAAYFDADNTLTLSVNENWVRGRFSAGPGITYNSSTGLISSVASAPVAGVGISVTGTGPWTVANTGVLSVNGQTGHVTVSGGGSYSDEQARDAAAAMIGPGAGLSWEYDDDANTLVGAVSQGYIRGSLSATAPVVYNSTTGVFSMPAATSSVDGYLTALDWAAFNLKVSSSRAINTSHSLTGGGTLSSDLILSLVNDVSAPGANMVYGTNGSGVKGWYAGGSGGGSGSVTSVGLIMPSGFSVSGSPVTSTGDLTVTTALDGIVKASGGSFDVVTVGAGLGYDGTTLTADVAVEADPVWGASPSAGITSGNITTWNSALQNITGLVTNGTGISISGSGTSGSPYVVSSTTSLSSISLATSNVIFNTPVNFSNSLGAWTGTMSLKTQATKAVLIGPVSGADATPTFRLLAATDIPALDYAPLSGSANYVQNQTAVAQSASYRISGSASAGSLSLTSGTLGLYSSSGDLSAPPAAGHLFYNSSLNRARIYQSGAYTSLLTEIDAIWNQTAAWQTAAFRITGTSYIQTALRIGIESAGPSLSIPAGNILYVYGGNALFGTDITVGRDIYSTSRVISTDQMWSQRSGSGGAAFVMTATLGGYGKIQCQSKTSFVNGLSGTTLPSGRFAMSFHTSATAAVGQDVLWWEAIPVSSTPTIYQAGVSPVFEPLSTNATWRFRAFSITPEIKITTTTNDFVGLFYQATLTSTNGAKNYAFWAQNGGLRIVTLASGATSEVMDGTVKYLIADQDGDVGTTSVIAASGTVPTSSADASGVEGEIRHGAGLLYYKSGGSWYKLTGVTF